MPEYIAKLLLKFKYGDPRNVQSSPYKAPPKIDKRETRGDTADKQGQAETREGKSRLQHWANRNKRWKE